MHTQIPLLGKSIHDQSPRTYYEFICGLRVHTRNRKDPVVKGRVKVTPTLKRLGVYEVDFQDKQTTFEFNKNKTLNNFNVKSVCASLGCTELQFIEFLKKKNFSA